MRARITAERQCEDAVKLANVSSCPCVGVALESMEGGRVQEEVCRSIAVAEAKAGKLKRASRR
jgi:hypothetical protein